MEAWASGGGSGREGPGGQVQHEDNDPAKPVVEVWIQSNALKNEDLRPIGAFKELRRCYFGGGPELTDAALEHLRGLNQLEDFSLDAPHQIGDAGMTVVAGWTNLTALGLGWTPVTDAGTEKLKALQKLRRIYLISSVPRSFGGISDLSCEHLARLPNLRSVALFDAAITSKGLAHIGTMTNLTFLNLSANPYLRDQGWEHLRGLKQLGALWLFDTSIGDEALRHIGTLTQLKHLCLSGTYVTSAGMAHLRGLNNLEILWLGGEMRPTLSLGGSRVDDHGLKHLMGLSSLRILVLDRTLVTEAGLATVVQMPGLQAVTLRELPITDAGVAVLKTHPNLQGLHLSGTRVTDAALAYAAEMPQLQEVELNETAITDEGLKHLYGLKNLKRVWLTDTRVTDAGVEALRKALPEGLDIRR